MQAGIPDTVSLTAGQLRAGLAEINQLVQEQLVRKEEEGQRLRNAIREHRDQHGDDRCWMDDQKLYEVLGDGNLGDNRIGDPEAMLANCKRFIEKRCVTGGPWKSYAELERENEQLRERAKILSAEINECYQVIESMKND